MTTMTTDSPYYKWASKLIEHVKANFSMTSMRLAEKIEAELPDFLDEIDWCGKCEERCSGDCDRDREPQINEGYL